MCNEEEQDCSCYGLLDSNDVRTAVISGDTFKNRVVQYAAVDGLAVFEGCIVLGTVEEVEAATQDARAALDAEGAESDVAHGVVITGQDKRWPGGLMPYEVDPALPNKSRVTNAIQHWRDNTAMRFVERTSANASQYPNYVRFRPASGCWSQVGMRGGRQDIGLANGCSTGSTIHEIGHAFGLWHEQSREDRDSKVRINWQNITAGKEHNFNQHISDGDDIGPYDYNSIMHYGRFAFSKNGQPTIDTIPAGISIGQRSTLSQGDIDAIHAIYRTWETTTLDRIYSSTSSKNCWVSPVGEGWLKIDPATKDGCGNLFDLCCNAFAFGKQVRLLKDGQKVYRAELR